MENMTEESAGKPLSNIVSGTPETENHLDTVAELANSAVRSARNIVKERILISLVNDLKNEQLTTHEDKENVSLVISDTLSSMLEQM
ncbi:hypothetical protein Tco_0546883 [Tanacetum coccineum]